MFTDVIVMLIILLLLKGIRSIMVIISSLPRTEEMPSYFAIVMTMTSSSTDLNSDPYCDTLFF